MDHQFIDLGRRNKGLYWEYLSAYSFLHTVMEGTAFAIPCFLGFGRGVSNNHCHRKDVLEKNRDIMIKEFGQGKYTEEFFFKLDRMYRVLLPTVREVCSRDFSNIDTKEIVSAFSVVWKAMAEGNKPMLLGLMAQNLQEFFEGEVREIVGSDQKIVITATALLLAPTKPTQVQIEEELLMNLEKRFGDSSTFLAFCDTVEGKKALAELVDKAGWFHMEYINDPWTENDYKEHILNRFGKHDEVSPTARTQQTLKKQQEFFRKHKGATVLKELSFALQEFSFILYASKAVIIEIRYRALALYDEIASRLGVSRRDLLLLSPPEISSLLLASQKADKELIKERWKARAVWLHDDKIELFSGKKAEELAQKLIELPEQQKDNVKGIICFPGIVRGNACVVHTVEDHKKFHDGDILVAHDVSTEYTSLLKRASAIVTDQGGIICHAAIVAREFKKPCIVGTGSASDIFKDGDIVEVDAHKGVVRKI